MSGPAVTTGGGRRVYVASGQANGWAAGGRRRRPERTTKCEIFPEGEAKCLWWPNVEREGGWMGLGGLRRSMGSSVCRSSRSMVRAIFHTRLLFGKTKGTVVVSTLRGRQGVARTAHACVRRGRDSGETRKRASKNDEAQAKEARIHVTQRTHNPFLAHSFA